MSLTDRSRISDREKAGLRGPVRTVSQDTTNTEYDRDGRRINNRWLSNPNSESVEAWTYDSSGRLRSDTVCEASGTLTETTYFYDDEGKLARIVHGDGDRTSFQYDDEGRKTEVREIAHASDVQQRAIATGIDVVFANVEGDPAFGFDMTRNASRIKTIYDEHDLPTETQAFDAEGNLSGRIVRTYDELHRITSVRVIIDDASSVFSAKQKTEMAAQANLPLDEIKAHFKKALGVAMFSESAISHTYDSQGRRTKTVLHHGLLGEVTRTYSYNDHGDVI